jgi:tRNA(fMet)-specific endonuclease VapC
MISPARFLLDTNILIAFLNAPVASPVAERCRQTGFAKIAVSSIAIHELRYGAYRGSAEKRARNGRQLALIEWLRLPFDDGDADEAGRVRAYLADRGQPIGPYDVLLAGQALARNLTFETANRRGFERVDGLRIEDWTLLAQ